MKKKLWLWAVAGMLAVLSGIAFVLYNGILLINNPGRDQYPVWGVDVSHYQGEINWEVLAGSGIDFAYIKATEGSSFEDDTFEQNWIGVREAGLKAGAYHFFSFDSPGADQAANFIGRVPLEADAMPPVVDVEFYGDKERNPPERESVQAELDAVLVELEVYYGKRPVLYVTEASYVQYIQGEYTEYPLWIRSVYSKPSYGRNIWTFWQYSNRGRLEGYQGEERFIDLNVFQGSREEFEAFCG